MAAKAAARARRLVISTLALIALASAAAEAGAQPYPRAPASAAPASVAWPSDGVLLHPSDDDWLMFNRDYAGDRHSALSQINAANAGGLQLVCVLQFGVLGGFQGSPIIYQGMGFVATNYGVYAFDAATCDRKWSYVYTPSGPEPYATTRGLGIYDGKLFRGTTDGHLLALDAATGKLLWDAAVGDSKLGYGVGAAPIAFNGRVIVGLAGSDYGQPGHVYAFDARTGKTLWTFDTVKADSWTKGAEYGGGATWTTVAVDPKDNLVFVPIGNPGPDFNPAPRPGDNLYTNSVVALDAATGKLAWYVQQVPADWHDWDTAAAPAIYEQDGHRYLAVGNKGGYLYIYDRDTHALVSKTSLVTRLNDTLPFTEKPMRVCPGAISGVEWNGPAYDPASKSLFINSIEWCQIFATQKHEEKKPGAVYLEATTGVDPPELRYGWTRSLDAATGVERWARKAPMPMTGAVTSTAGGVVMTGGGDGRFVVLDQKDGRELYSFNTGGEIDGGVATYAVGGRQYVAVASGGHGLLPFGVDGAPTLLVFALTR